MCVKAGINAAQNHGGYGYGDQKLDQGKALIACSQIHDLGVPSPLYCLYGYSLVVHTPSSNAKNVPTEVTA